jgi:hypothetical protein
MPNATVRANARPMPKQPPGSVASIRGKTADLESATALLKAAKAVEADNMRNFQAVMDIEMRVRNLSHLASIVSEWATDQNFFHPDSNVDADENRRRGDQTDRLVFAIEQIAERAADLDRTFHSGFAALRGTAQ